MTLPFSIKTVLKVLGIILILYLLVYAFLMFVYKDDCSGWSDAGCVYPAGSN